MKKSRYAILKFKFVIPISFHVECLTNTTHAQQHDKANAPNINEIDLKKVFSETFFKLVIVLN